ncbi:MAG: ATP-binding protein [Nitrosospira sp.]
MIPKPSIQNDAHNIDLEGCDSEPVNFSSAIQPFGALAVLSGEAIVNWSANISELLGISASSPIDLGAIFDDAARLNLDAILGLRVGDGPLPPFLLNTRNGRLFNALAHRHCNRVIVEFEPVVREIEDQSHQLEYELATLVSLLDGTQALAEVCSDAVRALRKMSGYDRVMIYRFHDDMHGEVVAEAASEKYESWLGLHYPASDIPQPAREIFLLNKLRVIPDVNYDSVPIVGPGSTTLDLGRSLFRSASAIHIEYLKNMHVRASLTVSIKVRGALWGLIACHHYDGPRLPTFSERHRYVMAGDYVSSAIGRRIEDELIAQRVRVREIERTLRNRMETLPDLTDALTGSEVTALALMSESTGGLAVRYGEAWARIGVTPSLPELEELGRFLEDRVSEETLAVDSLSEMHKQSFAYSSVASGLLSISVPDAANALVLWFKPETLQTLTWGGDPAKRMTSDSDRLHPRKSFAAWKEAVQRKSLPWKRWEIEAATVLRDVIIAARLRYQYEREQQARSEAERAKRTREEFMAVLSHDLRNPLNSVMLSVDLLDNISTSRERSIISTMGRAAKQMQWLINGLLDIAQAESGTLVLDVQRVSAAGFINNAVSVMSPIAQARHVTLQTRLPEDEVFVRCDEQRILQVLSNLIGNAIKFTPKDGHIDLMLDASATTATFQIADSGPGIAFNQLPHIFDRFWRGANTHGHGVGVGLGLSIVQAIIAAHEAKVTASNRPGGGACFSFTLERD